MLVTLITISLFILLISFKTTEYILNHSVANEIYDVPNNRSSHHLPKPKGGGVSIVLSLFLTICIMSLVGVINNTLALCLICGGAIVAVIGLVDDHKNLSVLIRIFFYGVASAVTIYLLGGFKDFVINNKIIHLNEYGMILGFLFILWMTNLYNFMDGIDGFAATQTICTSLFAGTLSFMLEIQPLAILLFVLAFSTLGFLYWNWAPAKIFMGDIGSCTIGFIFGVLALYTEKNHTISLVMWLILLAPFICDATYTLLYRMLKNEKWYQAHNSHAFQRLFQIGFSHRKITLSLLVLNIFCMWPFAALARIYETKQLLFFLCTYILVSLLWFVIQHKYNKFKA